MRKSEDKLEESEGRKEWNGEDDYNNAVAFHFQENKSTQKLSSRIQSGASGRL
jgi:hypothetical protein